jgi:hypothetical protein
MMGMPVRFGLGFGLPGGMLKLPLPNPNTLFWSGGGSLIIIDMDDRTTFAYAMNKMEASIIGDARSYSIIQTMWQALAA